MMEMEKPVRLSKVFCYMYATSLLFIPAMTAGPAVRESIVTLTSSSDAIVVGAAEVTALNGTVSASIRADRVLKGSVIQGSTVSVIWTMPENRFGYGKGEVLSSTEHGIFFLRRASNGPWSLVPVTNGDVRWGDTYIATPQTIPESLREVALASLPSNASVLDKVLQEMSAAVEAGAVPVSAAPDRQ